MIYAIFSYRQREAADQMLIWTKDPTILNLGVKVVSIPAT